MNNQHTDPLDGVEDAARAERVKGLRKMAFILARFPDLPEPDSMFAYGEPMQFTSYLPGSISGEQARETLRDVVRSLKRSFSRIDKDYAGNNLCVVVHLSENVTFTVKADRDAVCERKQAGTKTEKKPVYAVPEPPLQYEEVQVPVYEYDCGSLLGER